MHSTYAYIYIYSIYILHPLNGAYIYIYIYISLRNIYIYILLSRSIGACGHMPCIAIHTTLFNGACCHMPCIVMHSTYMYIYIYIASV